MVVASTARGDDACYLESVWVTPRYFSIGPPLSEIRKSNNKKKSRRSAISGALLPIVREVGDDQLCLRCV